MQQAGGRRSKADADIVGSHHSSDDRR
jgi:hypothetical protein